VFLEHSQAQDLQHLMHRSFQLQPLAHDCREHIGAHGDPDLRLHGILGRAEERLDAQMLLDNFP
jgi:hypothetical protein